MTPILLGEDLQVFVDCCDSHDSLEIASLMPIRRHFLGWDEPLTESPSPGTDRRIADSAGKRQQVLVLAMITSAVDIAPYSGQYMALVGVIM